MKRTEKEVIDACKNSMSMSEAARRLQIKYDTLKKYAIDLGVWNPNQSGKGISKKQYSTEDIISGKVKIKSRELLKRLTTEGYKLYFCECCGIDNWKGYPITLELHHLDGNRYNNSLDNLQILCPNCHSQTDNFRGRKKRV